MHTFVQPAAAHVEELAREMRRADCIEVLALGMHPVVALEHSLKNSHLSTTLLIDGGVAAMGGLAYDGRGDAQVWVLTSALVDRKPWPFWRASNEFLAAALRRVGKIYQHVDARHSRALRWLDALGFVRHPAEAFGPSGLPFHLVTRGT